MQINLFSSQTFEIAKQTINRFLTPQQQRICAVAMLAFSCLTMARLALPLLSKVIKMHFYDPEFEKGLNIWIELEKGNAYIAAIKIRKAYYHQRTSLLLNRHDLKSLPLEIGKLTNLKKLDLSINELKNVPKSIGNLVNLTELYLFGNKLEKVPKSIGNLVNLTGLYLSINKLKKVPKSIGNLVNLRELRLLHNQIENVPESIGNLVSLTQLHLSYNKLENVPESIGNLVNLTRLDLMHNPIYSLPLSLGQCSQLTDLYCIGTLIPAAMLNATLNMCQASRAKDALQVLPKRLDSWQTFAGQTFALKFIENLSAEERQNINEWLTRLERTHDFNVPSHQQKLAKSVCQMLESLKTSPSFKEIFFVQVPANLVACGDRAAMSFNELGLAWTCDTLTLSLLSKKEKLNTLIQASKTQALHQALQRHIEAQETKNAHEVGESVEIYLYYETHLKDKLNLLTFMSNMLYAGIGKRDWIPENTLITEVNASYEDCLLDLPAFLLICEADANFSSDWQEIEDTLYEEMEQLDPKAMSEGKYRLQMDRLQKEFENQKRSCMLKWVKSELAK